MRVCLFFSFRLCILSIDPDALQDMSCTVVKWFSATDNEPDTETGLWVVEPDLDTNGSHVLDVIDVKTIFWGTHLIPVFGEHPVPLYTKFSDSLDSYRAYYVNRYADHHAHDISKNLYTTVVLCSLYSRGCAVATPPLCSAR